MKKILVILSFSIAVSSVFGMDEYIRSGVYRSNSKGAVKRTPVSQVSIPETNCFGVQRKNRQRSPQRKEEDSSTCKNTVGTTTSSIEFSDEKKADLLFATEMGDIEKVNRALEQKSDINQKDLLGDTPLIIAVRNNRMDIAQCLINHGAKLDVKNKDGDTALSVAFRSKNSDSKRLLMNQLLSRESTENTAKVITDLMKSIPDHMYEQAAEKIKLLIYSAVKAKNSRDSSKIRDIDREISFIRSVEDSVYNGDVSTLEKLLKDQTILNMNSVLFLAIFAGQLGALKCAIEHGADVNCKDYDHTPLFAAVSKNNYELVEYLLSKGAKVDEKTSSGYTPLFLAFKHGYVSIFMKLMTYVPREEQKRVGQELKRDILKEFPRYESEFQMPVPSTMEEAQRMQDDLVTRLQSVDNRERIERSMSEFGEKFSRK